MSQLAIQPSAVRAAERAMFLRLFLWDGTAAVSYGEYTRVGDRVIFPLPIGALDDQPQLHIVDLPARMVNWPNTDGYAESARFAHYASTRGDADFAAMTGEVAWMLNSIALAAPSDSQRRLDMARKARQIVAEWSQTHYGYRAAEVREVLAILDESISELRAAAGVAAFALDLVAAIEPPPLRPLLPDPTPSESISQAMAVSQFVDSSAERLSLLRAIVSVLDDPATSVPRDWAKRTRSSVLGAIEKDLKVEREYNNLTKTMLDSAAAAATRGDVRVLEGVLETIRERDAGLGHQRPAEILALTATVQARLESARRLRLAYDQWALDDRPSRSYYKEITKVLERLERDERLLDDIKRLAGPDSSTLLKLKARLAEFSRTLQELTASRDARSGHTLLLSGVHMAQNAVESRRNAVSTGDLRGAWEAGSAASGALMLIERARAELTPLFRDPFRR